MTGGAQAPSTTILTYVPARVKPMLDVIELVLAVVQVILSVAICVMLWKSMRK